MFGMIVRIKEGERHDGSLPYALIVNEDGPTSDDYRYTALFLDNINEPTIANKFNLYKSEIDYALVKADRDFILLAWKLERNIKS